MKTKNKLTPGLILLLFGTVASMQAQMTLNPGDSYSYTFSSLPFVRQIVGQPGANYGYFYFNFVPATFDSGDNVRLQFFENSLSDPPVQTMDITPANVPPYGIYVGQGWQDIQGAFQIIQLTGSSAIESINVQVVKMNQDPSFNFYQQIVTPVPEPSTVALLAAGVASACVWRWRKRRSS